MILKIFFQKKALKKEEFCLLLKGMLRDLGVISRIKRMMSSEVTIV